MEEKRKTAFQRSQFTTLYEGILNSYALLNTKTDVKKSRRCHFHLDTHHFQELGQHDCISYYIRNIMISSLVEPKLQFVGKILFISKVQKDNCL